MNDLPRKRDQLKKRLDDGWDKIEIANATMQDQESVRKWEDFWLSLLEEYKSVCDEIAKENANGERNH